MDLNEVKAKLASFTEKKEKKTYEKIDYAKYYWKPQVGKTVIRILPLKSNPTYPFQEVFFHYNIKPFSFLALNNFGESDPIVKFAEELKATKSKENYQLANSLMPKMRVFVQVIVRGEEEKGVRLWEFSKETYTQLLGIMADEDYGDITSITDGFDITIEGKADTYKGKPVVKISSIRPKPKQSPISSKSTEAENWLQNQVDLFSLHRRHSYDEIKKFLEEWINKDSETEAKTETEAKVETEAKTETKTIKAATDDLPWSNEEISPIKTKKSVKANTSDKFDALFT